MRRSHVSACRSSLQVGGEAVAAALAAVAGLLVAAERAGRVELVERVGPHHAGAQRAGHVQDPRALLGPDARPRGRTACCWPSRPPRTGVRKVSTDSTGPKISSRAIRWAWVTPVKSVGGNQKPLRRAARTAATSARRPRPRRCRQSSRMRASCSAELMAPTSVFLSSGSPTRSVAIRRLSRSSSSSAIDSCTSSREPAQQTWPWLKKMPLTMPSTAWSSGASSKTMLAALPPSSRVTFLSVPATVRAIALPTSVEPVKATLSTSGWADERLAGGAGAGDDVDDARRQVGLLADLGEEQRGQRRGLGRLEHDGVAAGQRRGDLPRQHQQREVPRDDLAGDAERRSVP